MKNNQSLLNLRRSATRLLAFLFLTLLGIGQMWGAANGTYSNKTVEGNTTTWDFGAATTGSSKKITSGTVDNGILFVNASNSNQQLASSGGLSNKAYSEIWLPVSSATASGTVSMTTYSTSDSRWLQLYVGTTEAAATKRLWSKYNETPTSDGKKGPQSFEFTSSDLTLNGTTYYLKFESNNTEMKIATLTIVESAAAVPYTVTFDANTNGTCATTSLTEASAGAGVTLPSATANTGYTFLGWATTDDATEAAYNAGANYKPSADITLYAVYEVFVQKYAVNFDAGEGTGSMDTKMYAEGATVTLPACGFTAPDGKVFAGWSDGVNTYAAGDEFTMPAQAVTFTAQWEKVFGLIVKAVAGGNANYTFDTNIIGATCSADLSSGKKVDSGKFFGIIGSFKAGDEVNVNITNVSGGKLMIFNAKSADVEHLIYSLDNYGNKGDNIFTLENDVDAIWVYRDNNYCTWNPNINFISVTRPRDILSQNYWGFKKDGAILRNPEDYTWNEGVVTLNESYKTMSAPEDYTWTNHITYEGNLTEDVDVPVEFALNGGFWEATKEFDDQTVTIKVPVDNTTYIYFHYVENFNDASSPYIGYGETWSELTVTETIGGAKWYKYTKGSLNNVIVSYNNGDDKRTQTLNISELSGEDNYYVIYNSWFEETSGDWRMRVRKVEDPTRKSINVYFQNPGWPSVSEFKMWVEDGVNGANVYGTTADYDFTTSKTYAGETWYNATIHYFGDNCTIYPKFKEGDVQWEASAGIAGNTANVYIYYNGLNADVDATHKKFVAGVSTSMLYAEGAGVAQADVTEATTWDWTKTGASSNVQLSDDTYPNRFTDFVVANLLAENANFKSSALAMTTEYVVRDKKYAQATSVKFHTTVPGMVTVVFSNTGGDRPNRYLHVNGVSTGVGSNASTEKHKTATAFVGAGDVLINAYFDESDFTDGSFTTNGKTTSYDANNQMLRIYSITFTPGYSRTVEAGKYGTICLPYAVAELPEGYTFYDVTGVLGTTTVTGIVMEEVNALVAGKPYVFDAEAAGTLTLAYSGEPVAEAANTDYLTGNLTAEEMPVPQDSYLILKTDNKLHKIAFEGAVIQPNKAYFTLTPNGSVNPAPGRRVIYVADATDTATGLDNLNAAEQVKFLQNGVLYIRVADRIYDATGRLVK